MIDLIEEAKDIIANIRNAGALGEISAQAEEELVASVLSDVAEQAELPDLREL